ncbi:16S rRNA (guanine(527)-N(7))-methyltransferase RsmG [Roseicella frigidaeris]|uniref:Ribosomal RNA small subunit methyltransferase G n=1 Tax=Roseicella frigidaeris TaxID=2230885 RepID=A0A327MAW0_9PROT|nr:16S rRNA (guanine(527)-N(7))-methyltransferase RsmG [Roseicella frigidaeris]RAI59667.1 16S rRNA (guanine(527)-N(7))-methyltransferase RsmG [Roseicella frigidaeris]
MKHLGLNVPRETEDRLHEFVALLQRWNTRINLTAERDQAGLWQRHVQDSLQLWPLLPEAEGVLVDLGSGAGFPGLILAAVTGWETHLVEADRRKSAFLIEASRTLALPRVQVHAQRIEAAHLPKAAILTARALAPLTTLLAYAASILRPDGIALFPKGRTAAQELTEASRAWIMRTERFPSRTDPAATIFRISEIRPAGSPT